MRVGFQMDLVLPYGQICRPMVTRGYFSWRCGMFMSILTGQDSLDPSSYGTVGIRVSQAMVMDSESEVVDGAPGVDVSPKPLRKPLDFVLCKLRARLK
jgi:hypothetical protein